MAWARYLSLEKYGYRSVIFFDNYGRFILLTTPLSDQKDLIKQLTSHILTIIKASVGYYDICLFHENDTDLAGEIYRNGYCTLDLGTGF
jgi:hypothetical protein